jgi:hypothetical protein
MATVPSACADNEAKAPLKAPTGVRAAEAITISVMGADILPEQLGVASQNFIYLVDGRITLIGAQLPPLCSAKTILHQILSQTAQPVAQGLP